MTSILIVDDEVDITSTFSMLFEIHGFEVAHASHGEQALAKLGDFTPDVILSDCMMPLMDGLALCNRVKNNPATAHIPFILMSGAPWNHDMSSAKYDLFLQKPISFDVLMSNVLTLLGKQ